jgi:hypothetical protein
MPREISYHDLKSLRRVVSTTSLPTGECECNFSSTNNITTLKQNSLNVPTIASWFFISLVRSQALLSQFHSTQLITKTVAVMMAISREDSLF